MLVRLGVIFRPRKEDGRLYLNWGSLREARKTSGGMKRIRRISSRLIEAARMARTQQEKSCRHDCRVV